MLIGKPETALGQALTHPECKAIHYTDNQDKRCLECLMNSPKKEKQLISLRKDIALCDSIGTQLESDKSYLKNDIIEINLDLGKTNKLLKTSLKFNKYGIPISFSVGAIVMYAIIK